MFTGSELRTRIGSDGQLTLSIEQVEISAPVEDELVIRVEAAPINPTDLGLLLGPADFSSMAAQGSTLTFTVPHDRLAGVKGRLGLSLPVGLEGAGTVVAAGPQAKALEGRVVTTMGRGMFTQYRKLRANDVVTLPEGMSAAEGASIVNPLTALAIMETAKREGHRAIVHNAAASNVGQMLNKICAADGVPLVNIVRSQEQVDILRRIGAVHAINSSDADFLDQLDAALAETDATIAFDAIGGGAMGSQMLEAMERVAVAKMTQYVRTGSDVFKQLYVYGALDFSTTVLNRPAVGYYWGMGGWIVFQVLRDIGPEGVDRLTQRMIDEFKTTFAIDYTRVIGLAEALQPDVLRACERKATGEKFLIDPSRG
ncbi:zinc-binding dehydrogenase [Sphingomonas sp. SRS2]|uniref:zinc-binding dehydrogenase n=1 Tax=Sphingomonas sp. SRS2 TaxID=133190 RepID=UPI000618438A|nr:zinc-binding dehydrogenase [Sphingomonas sp. SRS2]KKC27168.1 NADH oxidase [Sphingomonas sp. SRS2]